MLEYVINKVRDLLESDKRLRELEKRLISEGDWQDFLAYRIARLRNKLGWDATMANFAGAQPIIFTEKGQTKRVTNLGWLLKNWRYVESMRVDLLTDTRWDAVLRVELQGNKWYETTFASKDHLWDWLNRPVFRGTYLIWGTTRTLVGGPRPPGVRAYKRHEIRQHRSGFGHYRIDND